MKTALSAVLAAVGIQDESCKATSIYFTPLNCVIGNFVEKMENSGHRPKFSTKRVVNAISIKGR